MIAIINYNMGNLQSVLKAFDRIGVKATITNEPSIIRDCEKIVLPGVGHFKHGMKQLFELGLLDVLNNEVLEKKKPILGICLGMQLLTNFSSEGDTDGLGWVQAETTKFKKGDVDSWMKIPHMGWNNVKEVNQSVLFYDIREDDIFYFVHSYYVKNENQNEIVGITKYGKEFTSAFQKNNIYGVQFHPEKSHDVGLQLLKNFTNLT